MYIFELGFSSFHALSAVLASDLCFGVFALGSDSILLLNSFLGFDFKLDLICSNFVFVLELFK